VIVLQYEMSILHLLILTEKKEDDGKGEWVLPDLHQPIC
jgi:hypothetical protein